METSQTVLHFARRFFAGTLLSRMSGALRDITMAVCFGSAPEVGAFMVAYRLANLFRRLFGEGSIQAGLIPSFSGSTVGKRDLYFFRDCFFSCSIALFLMVIFLEGILWGVSQIVPADWEEIVLLTMRMIPGLVFICLYAINSAFLQARERFFLSGFAPVMFNSCWVLFAIYAKDFAPKDAMKFLATGVTFAFVCQWAVTLRQVHTYLPLKWRDWARPRLFSEEFRTLLRPVLLGVVGVGATQISTAIDTIFSRFSDLSGPAYLWYAIRIQQLPLALFGIALSGALLPPLSRAFKEGAMDRYAELLQKAIRHSTALLVPCTFAIFSLGGAGLNLLYGHGDFLSGDIFKTLLCLWGYGLGLVPSVVGLLMGAAFFARKSYGIPAAVSVFTIFFQMGLNTLFVFFFEHGSYSIALSTSFGSFLNCILLAFLTKSRLGVNPFSAFSLFFLRLIFAGGFASVVTLYFGKIAFHDPVLTGGEFTRVFSTQALQVLSTSALFILTFALISRFMNLNEVFAFLKKEKISIN